jgi:hypothetical protein
MRRIDQRSETERSFVRRALSIARCPLAIAWLGIAFASGVGAQPLALEAALVSSGAGAAEASPVRVEVTVGQPAAGRTGSGTLAVELGFFTVEGRPGVDVDDEAAPPAFSLEANYPNPFTRSTTIAYALPAAADVRLEVLDVLGRRVRTLVESEQAAGRHRHSFEAAGLSSGVYVYRLRTGDRTATRMMQVVR